MKYYKRLKIYKNSANTNYFDPVKVEAYSYNWWCYVKVIKGKVIFNNHSYSNSTSKHQSQTLSLLRQLNIKVDHYVDIPEGLQNFESKALRSVYREMFDLEIANQRKGAHKKKVKSRLHRIEQLKDDIKLLRSLGAKLSKAEQSQIKADAEQSEKLRLERLAKEKDRKLEKLAKRLDLTYDNDGTNRAFYDHDRFCWTAETKAEYEKVENQIKDFGIERPKYSIYTWCDISGYEYWVKGQQESNYCMLTVHFKTDRINESDIYRLEFDLAEAIDFCESIKMEIDDIDNTLRLANQTEAEVINLF